MDERIAELESRYAHQEKLLQQLDEALLDQGRRLDELVTKVEVLVAHVKALGPPGGEGEEPPPPHY